MLDRIAPGAQVQPQHFALPFVGNDQAADHPQRGGLARPIGPEKSADPPWRDRQVDMIDHGAAAEPLGQTVHRDGGHLAHCCSIATGSPGGKGLSDAGSIASTRNTSLARARSL